MFTIKSNLLLEVSIWHKYTVLRCTQEIHLEHTKNIVVVIIIIIIIIHGPAAQLHQQATHTIIFIV